MADNVVYFEIASLPIFVILLMATYFRKMYKGRANVLLIVIIELAFTAALFDTIGNLIGKHLPLTKAGVIIITLANYIYFFARCGMNAVYTFYLVAVTRNWYRIKVFWKKLLILVPFLLSVLLLAYNEKNHYVFQVTQEVGYERGRYILVVYGLAALYMIFGIIYLVWKRKLLSLSEWISIAMLYVFNIVGVVIQYFYTTLLVECFFASVTLLCVVLFVQKPEKKIDFNTSLPGYFAYREEIGKILATRQRVQVIIASITNAAEVSKYLGEKAYFEYIDTMNRAISSFAKKENVSYDFYFETPGCFYIIIEDIDYNPVQAIPDIRGKVRSMSGNVFATGLKPDLRIVSLVIPEDINNLNELLRFGKDFARFTGGKIFSHAYQIIDQRNYQIEARIDEILDRAIDNQKLEINLVPVWSVVLEKKLFVEAVPRICDEIFGTIEGQPLEDALKARGTYLLFEEYVLDQVFAYAGSGNLAKTGMSYVVVQLSNSLGMQTNFPDKIWNLRGKYDVHPELICFAIKENSNNIISDAFYENIKKLSLQGYRIALDGYGNGYSNIRRIAELPISSVRLDGTMISAVSSGGGRAVLSGTIKMLASIPLAVVAGGIDDKDTMKSLYNMGCQLMQGKYFEERYESSAGEVK